MRVRDMTRVALCAVGIAVCSWISIPFLVPFTMQTFAVFCCLGLLGGKRGALAVAVYILLGAVGLPVFSGFTGGLGALLGPTGGYIVGFLLMAAVYGGLEKVLPKGVWPMALALFAGLLACYALGTAWFLFVYNRTKGAVGLWTALGWCVFPFVLPDCGKLALALAVVRKLSRKSDIQAA